MNDRMNDRTRKHKFKESADGKEEVKKKQKQSQDNQLAQNQMLETVSNLHYRIINVCFAMTQLENGRT